jgi:AbrB family looped-hinge helix DNA binding protein
MKSHISERGQITIPKSLRDRYGLRQGVEVEFVPEDGGIRLHKVRGTDHPVDRVLGVLGTGGSTDDYIEEIRGR